MPDLSQIVSILTAAVTSAVILLAVISPLTKTEKDDAILKFLRWVEAALAKIILPGRKLK